MAPNSSAGAAPQGAPGRPPGGGGSRPGAKPRQLLATLAVALLVYVVTLLINRASGIDAEAVIRDLAQSCNLALGVGMLSNFGYLLWAAAAAIALFGASLIAAGGSGRQRQLLLCGGAFSALLCLDDMFLLHDKYIGSTFLYLLYAVFALLILLRFRGLVLALGGPSFLVSVLLLGSSILLDKLQDVLPFGYDNVQLFEEGFKFMGIAAWVHFWWQAAADGARRGRPAS